MNKGIVWGLFFVLTTMQAMGNAYYAYTHLENYQAWVELFALVDEDPIFQKRILSIVSGAILPLVALGFIKSLVDYIKPDSLQNQQPVVNDQITDSVTIETPTKNIDAVEVENNPVEIPVEEMIQTPENESTTGDDVSEGVEPVTEIEKDEVNIDDEKKN